MSQAVTRVQARRRQLPALNTLTIVFLTALLFLALSLTSRTFFTYSNIYSIFFGISIQFFALIGFTYLIIMGEIDLSIGAAYGFGGALLGIFTANWGIPFLPALLLTLAVAGLIGFINGFLVTRYRLISMMVTIGMMSVLKGLTSIFTSSLGAQIFPSIYRQFIKAKLFNVHWSILAFILLVVALELMLKRSAVFRQMYFIGHSGDTARLYGIKVARVKMGAFLTSSVAAAFGGILATSRITHAYPTTGLGLEFTVVTAAVLGGASLYGGRGSILRSVLGLLFLALVQNGMIIFGIDPYYQQVLMGAILVAAVFVDTRLNVRNR